jgi:histidine triad (HIT) family protein
MCIFCQIIAGDISSYKIYEDEKVLAMLDISPVFPGHMLVLPKKHVLNIEEVSEEDLSALIIVVKKMGLLLKDKLGYGGYNVTENNDSVSGQTVPHLHFHVIPRQSGDNLNLWPSAPYNSGEAEEISARLKS